MHRCIFYKGDYRERQEQANSDRCMAYVEHHFNSSVSPVASYAVLFRQVIDVDADVTWDGVRGVLRIDRPIPVIVPTRAQGKRLRLKRMRRVEHASG